MRAVVSDVGESVVVSDAAPTHEQMDLVQTYLDDAGKARALTAPSTTALVGMVEDRVKYWVIECHRGAWTPDVERLRRAIKDDWIRVAEALSDARALGFDDQRFAMTTAAVPGGEPDVLLGFREDASPPPAVRAAISALCDAHAWLSIAASSSRTHPAGTVEIRLLMDDPIARALAPGKATGGVDLFEWLHATSDANRAEAVRAEFRRIVEQRQDESVPDGKRVAAAAERIRIALVADNIAAIQTAITSATVETRAMVDEIDRKRFELRRDAVRNMLTVVLTVLGLSALLVRSPGLSPWLVWSAGIVVSLALVGSAIADERVLGSQITAALRLRTAIESREHLPSSDRDSLVAALAEASKKRAVTNLGWSVWAATAAAIIFVIVAAVTVGYPREVGGIANDGANPGTTSVRDR